MKILLCSPYVPKFKDNGGGIVKWAKNIMGYYETNKGDVDIEVMPFDRSIYVHDNLNFFVRMYNGAKDYLGLIRKTYIRIKNEHFDVLHLCSSAQWSVIRDYIVMKMARRKGVAGVVHFHCGRIPKLAEEGGMKWRILKRVVANASATDTYSWEQMFHSVWFRLDLQVFLRSGTGVRDTTPATRP